MPELKDNDAPDAMNRTADNECNVTFSKTNPWQKQPSNMSMMASRNPRRLCLGHTDTLIIRYTFTTATAATTAATITAAMHPNVLHEVPHPRLVR